MKGWIFLLALPCAAQPKTSAEYIEQAARNLEAGQNQLAADEYSQAIRLRLDDYKAWVGRGRAYTQLGKSSSAIDDFDQAVRLNPASVEAYVERGYAYGRTGEFANAIQDFNRALKADPKNTRALSLRGTAYSLTGQPQSAFEDRQEVLKLAPNWAEAYVARGTSYFELGQHELGFADFDKAIDMDGKLETAWASRGGAFLALGRHQEAIRDFNRALELKPDDERAKVALAQAQAAAALERQPVRVAVESTPAELTLPPVLPPWDLPLSVPDMPVAPLVGDALAVDAPLHNQRGRDLSKAGRFREAIDELNAAVAADSKFAAAYNARGFAYYMLRDYSRAIADFDKAIELNPGYKNAIDNRAVAVKAAARSTQR